MFRRSNVVLRRNDYSDTDNVIIIVLFKLLILIINNFLSLIFLTCLLLNVQLYFNMYICINLIVFEEIDKSVEFRLLSKHKVNYIWVSLKLSYTISFKQIFVAKAIARVCAGFVLKYARLPFTTNCYYTGFVNIYEACNWRSCISAVGITYLPLEGFLGYSRLVTDFYT